MPSRLVALLILGTIWESIARLWYMPFLPPLSQVLEYGFKIDPSQLSSLILHMGASLARLGAGLFLGIILGVIIGGFSGFFPQVDRYLGPMIFLTYSFPKVVLVPIFIIIFGIGETSKIGLLMLVVGHQMIIQVRDRMRSLPLHFIRVARSTKLTRWRFVCDLLAPYVLPGILTGARISIASGSAMLFFSETYATQIGLGFYIWDGFSQFDYLQVYFGSLLFCMIGFLIYEVIAVLEQRYTFWDQTKAINN